MDKLERRRRRASLLLIAGAAIVLALVVVLVSGFSLSQRASERTMAAIESARSNARAAFDVVEAVSQVEIGHRTYVSGDGVPTERAVYERGVAMTADALTRLQSLSRASPALDLAAENVRAAAETRLTYVARVIGLRDRGRRAEAVELMIAREGAVTSAQVRRDVFTFIDQNEAFVAALTQSESRQRARAGQFAIAVGLLAALACVLTVWAVLQERRSWRAAQIMMAEANAALEAAHAESRASDAAKTRFLAVASHDLRQPLHALSLYLSALKRRVEGPETQKIIANMERATQGMIHMFASLLDLARIQSGVVTSHVETIVLQEFFERIAAEFATGQVIIAPTPLAVRTDARALEGIMRNLVSNALKHGGGEARLEARPRADGVLVCVIDHGPGIPEDQREEIFGEFTRLPGTKAEGLGLGLTIVKRTAERVRLPVILESTSGHGALFGVVAPLAEDALVRTGEEVLGPSPLAGVFIIAVDDEPMPLAAAAQILRDAGAAVEAAPSVAALNALIDNGAAPDVIVMDLRLDGELRGVEAARAARARLPKKPAVIIVTGDTAPETLAMLQASGFSWTVKPVQPREFTGTVVIAASMAIRGPLLSARPFDTVEEHGA